MNPSALFSRELFEAAQPFFLVWGSEREILTISARLSQVWGFEEGSEPSLMVRRPFKGKFKAQFLNELTDVLLELHPEGRPELAFKGQVISLEESQYIFLCSPSVSHHDELKPYGMALSDLPIHERLGDLIIANETNQIALGRARASEVKLSESYETLRETNRVFRKFVPSEFIQGLGLERITDVKLGQHVSASLCVLFADLRNFSTLSESLEPTQVMSLVNGYLSSVTPAIQEAGGHIVQYQGDGVLAVFPGGVGGGIRASQKMQEAISLYSQEYFQGTTHKLKMGVGLHYGQVEMGIIGNEDRWESTVIADAVNTAARIESLTKPLGAEVLISDVVYNAYESRHAIETRRLGDFDVKGRASRVALREVLSSLDAEQRELRLETRTLFEGGVDALIEGDVSEAVLAFDEVIRKNPEDVAARVLQRRVLQGALTS